MLAFFLAFTLQENRLSEITIDNEGPFDGKSVLQYTLHFSPYDPSDKDPIIMAVVSYPEHQDAGIYIFLEADSIVDGQYHGSIDFNKNYLSEGEYSLTNGDVNHDKSGNTVEFLSPRFAFIDSEELECSAVPSSDKYNVQSSKVKIKCPKYMKTGQAKFMAGFNNPSSTNEFKYPITPDQTYSSLFYVDFSGNNEEFNTQDSFSVAFVRDTGADCQQTINIKLYGKPKLSELALADSIDAAAIQPGTTLTYTVQVNDAVDTSAGHIKCAVYQSGSVPNVDSLNNAKSYRANSNTITFTVDVPQGSNKGDYKVRALYYEENQLRSDSIDSASFTVKVNSITGCSAATDTKYKVDDENVKFKCTIEKVDGYTLVAKVGGDSTVAGEYTIRTYDLTAQGSFSISLQGLGITTSGNTQISFALVKGSEIGAKTSTTVTLYGKPTINEFRMTNPTDKSQIKKGIDITYSLEIKNVITSTEGTLKYGLYKDGRIVDGEKSKTINSYNDPATFDLHVPDDAEQGTNYEVKAQFYQIEEQKSDLSTDSFSVHANSIQCSLSEPNTKYTVTSTIGLTCTIVKFSDYILQAKVGTVTNNRSDYTINVDQESASNKYSIDLSKTEVTESQTSISIALVSGSTVGTSQNIQVNLYGKPKLSDLTLISDEASSKSIQKDTVLTFSATIENTFEVTQGKVKFALFKNSEPLNTGFGSIIPDEKNPTQSGNKYTFEFIVPETDAGEYKLRAKFVDNANQESDIVDSNSFNVKVNKLDCKIKADSKTIFGKSDSISFTCDSMLISGSIKAKLDDNSDSADAYTITRNEWKEGQSVEYTIKLNDVNFDQVFESISFAIISGDNVLVPNKVSGFRILPAPQVKSVADLKPKEYIYGQDITLKIVIGSFYNFQDAKIKYEFVENKESQFAKLVTATNKPEPVDNLPNEFRLKIPIPESEKKGSNKYLKIEFTDAAGQSAQVYSDKFIILYHIFIESDPTNVNNKKFKPEDLIKLTLTLSNLKDDWETSLQFGYAFDNKETSILNGGNVIQSKSSSARYLLEVPPQSMEVSIPIPKDMEIGKHQLDVFVVNNGQEMKPISNKVSNNVEIESKPVQHQPEQTQKGELNLIVHTDIPKPNEPEGKNNSWIIIVAVVSILLIIIAIAIIVYIIKKKKSEDDVQEDVENDVEETHINLDEEANPTDDKAMNLMNKIAVEDDIFDPGSDDVTADGFLHNNEDDVFI